MQQLETYDSFDAPPQPDVEDSDSPQPITATDKDGKRTLIGYAVVWGAISNRRTDGYRHQFVRGSLTWAKPTTALWSHDFKTPLASTSNGTLRIAEDDYGVRVEIDLDQTTAGNDAWIRVTDRLVTGMSFTGNRKRTDFRITNNPGVIQPFNMVGFEVTLTVIPAVTATEIAPAEDFQKSQKDRARLVAKNKLNTARLALLRPA